MRNLIGHITMRLPSLFGSKQKLQEEKEDEVWMLLRARIRICSMQLELLTLSRNMAIWIANLDRTCPPEMVADYKQKLAVAKRRTTELETELEHGVLGGLRSNGIQI
jgi:hypothetical protein